MTWAEKYRATKMSELIISPEILRSIVSWMNRWKSGEVTRKGIILYGEPGTGKTTALSVIAREIGFQLIEMNASDRRNSEKMKLVAKMGGMYRDLFSAEYSKADVPDKLILVDEADNIFEGRSSDTGGDTGGIRTLADIIQETRNPIALTMNEFYDFRRKSSAKAIIENCEVVDFRPYARRRTKEYSAYIARIKERIAQILELEKVRIPQDAIDLAIERNEPDMRAILNDLESLRHLSDIPEGSVELWDRDSPGSIYDIIDTTFRSRDYNKILMALRNKDFDTDDYIMWLDQNLPEMETNMTEIDRPFSVLAYSDWIKNQVFRKQHFAFKNLAEEISAGIGFSINRINEHYVKYQFPQYIRDRARIKNSGMGRRNISEKVGRMIHMGTRRCSDMLWLLETMKKHDKKAFAELAERLYLSPQEIASL